MHKYCSLKDITPGSCVRLPKEYALTEGETAVILGLEYNSDKKHIRGALLRTVPNTSLFDIAAMTDTSEDMELELVEDADLKTKTIQGFQKYLVQLPAILLSTGCDPEIFVLHEDESVFPAWEFMPNEETARLQGKQWLKESLVNPWLLPHKQEKPTNWSNPSDVDAPWKSIAYWDGAQAEFAPYAKSCLEALHCGTRAGLQAVIDFARAKDPKAKLTLRNVVELPEATLKNADAKYIQFRCSSSLNIYNDPGDGIPDARAYKYRCAGGHIHLGFTRRFTAPTIEQIIRGLDGVLGVIGVSLAAGIDDPERRHTYGRAGEFRLPAYGIEYRVLSNFWLSHPAIAMLVFELARASVRLSESGLFNLCWEAREEETREVINNCDVQGARNILKRNRPVLEGMLNGIWKQFNAREQVKMRDLAMKTILNGMNVAIAEPFEIEKNWKLGAITNFARHCHGPKESWNSLARGE